MLVGVPKEIKDNEFRVGMTPAAVAELVPHGQEVIVETSAGIGSGSPDEEYIRAGAKIVATGADVFAQAQMIVKVKEPLAEERKRLKRGQILFTYLLLAPDLEQTRDLMASGATCIAYETVTSPYGGLPLLTPMSEVAGRLAPQVVPHAPEKAQGGRGVLLGGVPGVAAANVVVLGGGVSGTHAATIAVGMGASVTVIDRSHEALKRLSAEFGSALRTVYSTRASIADLVRSADLVIGAVLLPGAAAPKLVTREMLKTMRPGAVIVDIAIDQGGCCETSKPTTHSPFALNPAPLPFALALADKGWVKALKDDPHLRAGLNVHEGKLTCEPVAAGHGLAYTPAESVLGGGERLPRCSPGPLMQPGGASSRKQTLINASK